MKGPVLGFGGPLLKGSDLHGSVMKVSVLKAAWYLCRFTVASRGSWCLYSVATVHHTLIAFVFFVRDGEQKH